MNLLAAGGPVVRDLHAVGAWVVVVSNGIAGVWALAARRAPRLDVAALWRFTLAAQVTIFVQVALGVVLLQGIDSEPYGMHLFYGFVAAFTVAIVFSYRSQLHEHRFVLYGFGGLFLMGLAIRAMTLLP